MSIQSLIVRRIGIVDQSYLRECMMDLSRQGQSGMMCEHSTEEISGRLTLYMEEVHASNYQTTIPWEKVWKAKKVRYFTNSPESLAKLDQNSFSWKMCKDSSLKTSRRSPLNSVSSGMIVNGWFYQLPRLELLTSEKDSSSMLYPTLTATDGTAGSVISGKDTYFRRKRAWRKVNAKGTEGSCHQGRL